MHQATVYISTPTWGPHRTIFVDSGLKVAEYPYWDPAARGIDFARMLQTVQVSPRPPPVLS